MYAYSINRNWSSNLPICIYQLMGMDFCPTPDPLVPYSSTPPYAFYYMLSFCVHFFHLLFLSLRSWDYPLFNRKYMSKLQKVLPSEKLDY